jgi:curved DNA-binding protein CbpA
MALKYHPDKNPSADAQELFQRIQLAKDMLLDPETKAALLRVKRCVWRRVAPLERPVDHLTEQVLVRDDW